MHVFPAQGNGYPGTNFGNKCWGGVYPGPGYNGVLDSSKDQLQAQCPSINNDIPICQSTYGKKIILALGGGTSTYQLTGVTDGEAFADFLWGAFGPRTSAWVTAGKPRPFDGPNGEEVQVDGFDMDIEYQSTGMTNRSVLKPHADNLDSSVGYIAMLQRLRVHFATASKTYLISGAPQCVVPDANMAQMISAVQFDLIFIQFYNTPFCSARNYISTSGISSGFSYDAWTNALAGTASANAKLYIGLPGSPTAAGSALNYWLDPTEAATLIKAFFCRANFGGIMLWDSTRAEAQVNDGRTYYQNIKLALLGAATDSTLPCVGGTASTLSSPTISFSTTSTRSSSPSASPSLITSTDGTCGNGKTCLGNVGGQCCSQYGWCGSSSAHCGTGCQSAFGLCSGMSSSSIAQPATSSAPRTSTTFSAQPATSSTLRTSTVFSAQPATSSTLRTSTTSSAQPAASSSSAYPPTTDGSCGSAVGKSCAGSGQCCSKWGWCGTGIDWCGANCQVGFGNCL